VTSRTTPADLGPAGAAGVVRLAPDEGDAGADEDGREEIGLGAVAQIHVADEDQCHDDHEEQGDDLALVGLTGDESAAAVR
jgi:hypothetical protein